MRAGRHCLLLLAALWLCAPSSPALGQETTATVEEIEAMIQALEDPFDSEATSAVLLGLSELDDPVEQERLQRLLDERRSRLLEQQMDAARHDIEGAHDGSIGLLDEQIQDDPGMLRFAIDRVTVGPTATVDDLRARDTLVARINQVTDPVLREELLAQLADKEAQAEQ